MLQIRGRTLSGARGFAISFVLVYCCLLGWAAALPMFSAPDEGAHIVRAYAVVHREHARVDPVTGVSQFRVPSVIGFGGNGDDPCYAFKPEQTADCMALDSTGPSHEVGSSAAAYLPFFHTLVGWPSLIVSGLASLYLMRAAAALFVALLIALALQNIARMPRRGVLVLGAAVALVPTTFYFGAVVNPSGLAIAAALALWTGGLVLGRTDDVHDLAWAAARFGVPLCVFLLLRRDSLIWAPLIVASLAALTSGPRLRVLIRSRAIWVWAAASAACALVQLAVSGSGAGATLEGGTASSGSFWGAVGDASAIAHQIQGGVLGWLDTALPFPVHYVFVVSTGFLVLAAIGFASRRVALTLLAMTATAIAVPLLIGTLRWPYFQGRYLLAFIPGIPLVAAAGLADRLARRSVPRRLVLLLLPLLCMAQIASFAQSLRRYADGASGSWWFFSAPRWEPPTGHPTLLLGLFTAAATALFVWLYLLIRTDRWPPTAPGA
jgi:hypothetical protein